MELIAEREDTFLRTALLLVTAGAAESGIELIFIQGMKQGLRLHQVRMHLASMRERAHARVEKPPILDSTIKFQPNFFA